MKSDEITFKQILSEDIKPGMIVIDPEEYQRLLEIEDSYTRLLEELKHEAWERDTYD